MNTNLITPFMIDGTKMPYKLKQTCIFQLLDYVSVHDVLLLYGMKVLKVKGIFNISMVLEYKHAIVYLFCAFP